MKRKNGDLDFRKTDNDGLYGWCNTQRELYKNGSLDEDKVDLLKKVDFNFEKPNRLKRISETKWQKQYQKLVDYYVSYRSCIHCVSIRPSLNISFMFEEGAW